MIMPFKIFFSISLLTLLTATPAHSYSPALHALIFQIALDELPTKKRTYILDEINYLSPKGCDLRDATAASWLDNQKLKLWQSNHFNTTMPYDPQKISKGRYKSSSNDLSYALNDLLYALKAIPLSEQSPFVRSLMLRFIVHLMGDAHQPLHAVTPLYKAYVTKQNPTGNTNEALSIQIQFSEDINNPPSVDDLHSLWDSEKLLFRIPHLPLNEEKLKDCFPPIASSDAHDVTRFQKSGLNRKLSKKYRKLYKSYVIKDLSIDNLLKESAHLGITQVLQPLEDQIFKLKSPQTPVLINSDYFKKAQKITETQVVVAGVRLGRLLDKNITVPKNYKGPGEKKGPLQRLFERILCPFR